MTQVICEENTKRYIKLIKRLCKFVGNQLTTFLLPHIYETD